MSKQAKRRPALRSSKKTKGGLPPAVKWLRNLGIVSMLIGATGSFMSVYFWTSVGLFYVGVTLLLVDLRFESFRLRWIFILVICLLAIAFGKGVVFHADPLTIVSGVQTSPYAATDVIDGIQWTPELRKVTVSFENDTDSAYTNLDFSVQLLDATILGRGHADNIPEVRFDNEEVSVTQRLPDGSIQPLKVFQNHYRFSCPRLSPFESLQIVFAVRNEDLAKLKRIRVAGQYQGAFRSRSIGSRNAPAEIPITVE